MIKIRYLEWTMLIIFILQNGYLNNLPALLLVMPIVIGLAKDNWKVKHLNKSEMAVVFWGVYLLIITLVNVRNLYNTSNIINVFIQYVLLFAAVHINYKKLDIDSFFVSYRNVGVVLSVLCMVEQAVKVHFFSIILGKTDMYHGIFRVVSIFGHPILCGVFLNVLLLVLIYYPYKNVFVQYISYMVSVMALLFTQSRSAWVAIAICLVIYWGKNNYTLLKGMKRSRLSAVVVLTIFTIVLVVTVGHSFLINLVSSLLIRISSSLNAGEGQIVRIETMANSFDYWLNGNLLKMIFGSGMNADLLFMKNHAISKFNGVFVWDAAIDNQYVSLIHECGLIGLILFLGIVYKTFAAIFKSDNRQKNLICLSLLSINITLFFFEGLKYISVVFMALLLYALNSRIKDSV